MGINYVERTANDATFHPLASISSTGIRVVLRVCKPPLGSTASRARQHCPLAALLELECSEQSTRLRTYRIVTSRSLHNHSLFLPSWFLRPSIMFFFNSSSLRAVSLDSWLSRLKSWLQPDHDYESQGDRSLDEKTSYDIHFNPVLLCPHSPLSLDLPSPTISLGFDIDLELSIETESELSSTESLPCHTLNFGDYSHADANLKSPHPISVESLCKNTPAATSTNPPAPSNLSRDALLAEYSHQELVLLEFMTHSSDMYTGDLDDVLIRYPPGFTQACRCVGMDEEGNDLCEVCHLLDAYMDYSLERFQAMDFKA